MPEKKIAANAYVTATLAVCSAIVTLSGTAGVFGSLATDLATGTTISAVGAALLIAFVVYVLWRYPTSHGGSQRVVVIGGNILIGVIIGLYAVTVVVLQTWGDLGGLHLAPRPRGLAQRPPGRAGVDPRPIGESGAGRDAGPATRAPSRRGRLPRRRHPGYLGRHSRTVHPAGPGRRSVDRQQLRHPSRLGRLGRVSLCWSADASSSLSHPPRWGSFSSASASHRSPTRRPKRDTVQTGQQRWWLSVCWRSSPHSR